MKNNLYNHNAWNRQGFIWLCSYPGCGNSFVRYILETVLNDMELFCRRFDSVLFDKYLKVYT
tara:strand:- start:425 stop:610 length:186 start_codon:yes stop_codon:yes gene_type:complete